MSVPEKHRPVAHAFVDGNPVQKEGPYKDQWLDDDNPRWHDHINYRVKPKTKVKKWRWVCKFANGDGLFITNQFHSEWEMSGGSGIQKIEATMIEVDE